MDKSAYLLGQGEPAEIANGESICPECRQWKPNWAQVNVALEGDTPNFVCTACWAAICAPARAQMQRQAELDARAAQLVDLEYVKAQAIADLGARRWAAESEGFSFGGQAIALNDQTQGRIGDALQGMRLICEADPEASPTVRWQVVPGVFITLDRPTLTAMGIAAFAHVQAAFENAETLTAAILAAETVEAVNAVDLAAGWPGTPPPVES